MFDNVPMRTVTQYDLIEMTFSIDCHWFSQDHSWESNLLPAAPVIHGELRRTYGGFGLVRVRLRVISARLQLTNT